MILVFGATGNVGREIVNLLVRAGTSVRAVTRNPFTANLPEQVDVRAGDLSAPQTLPPLFEGVERAYVMFHIPGDDAQPHHVLQAIENSSVRQVVMLSSLSVESNIPGDLVGQHHREAEKTLRSMKPQFIALRPGTFMSNSLNWAGQIKNGDVVHGLDYHPAAVIDERDVAAVAYALMTDQAATKEQALPLTGGEKLCSADQIRILCQVLERPLQFEPLSRGQAIDAIAQSMPGADAAAVLQSVTGPGVPWAEPRRTVEELLGRPPTNFHKWAQDHADRFR